MIQNFTKIDNLIHVKTWVNKTIYTIFGKIILYVFEKYHYNKQTDTKFYEMIQNESQSFKTFVSENKTLVSFVWYESF